MKLEQAIELAEVCGLQTLEEAILNIRFHAMNIFVYGKEVDEYEELLEDYKLHCETFGYNKDTKIKDLELL